MTKFDVLVVGGGPAGYAAAIALAGAGTGAAAGTGATVALIAPKPAPTSQPDTRTAALFTGSMRFLDHLGAMPLLAAAVEPLRGIRIVDDGDGLFRAPEVTFDARELGMDAFGANVPQVELALALQAAAETHPNLTIIHARVDSVASTVRDVTVTLDTGAVLSAHLLVAADGRQSRCREAVGIASTSWDYPQTAIAAQFTHSRPHRGISTEFHRPAGPCTVVPMPGNRSSLVWVERPAIASRLNETDDAAFALALEDRLHGVLGRVSALSSRRLFPLSALKAETVGRGRVVLVGEAGHALPPIGAQGLNLGLRDAAVLADLVADARSAHQDVGSDQLTAAYAAARNSDIALRTTAIDWLNRSLLADFLPVDMARGLGLHLTSAITALKRQVMRAGFEPVGSLPRLMQAQAPAMPR